MSKKYIPYLIVLAGVIIVVLLFIFGPRGQLRNDPPHVEPPITDIEIPILSDKQKRDMLKIRDEVINWESRHKNRHAYLTVEPLLVNARLEENVDGDDPYREYNKGSMLYLLKKYFEMLNKYEIKDEETETVKNELLEFYNALRSEPDPVTVTIVNRSPRTINYKGDAIRPGGKLSVRTNNRKLGEEAIGEGAFSFGEKTFIYNTKLKETAGQGDTGAFLWAMTGRSTYRLEILK